MCLCLKIEGTILELKRICLVHCSGVMLFGRSMRDGRVLPLPTDKSEQGTMLK